MILTLFLLSLLSIWTTLNQFTSETNIFVKTSFLFHFWWLPNTISLSLSPQPPTHPRASAQTHRVTATSSNIHSIRDNRVVWTKSRVYITPKMCEKLSVFISRWFCADVLLCCLCACLCWTDMQGPLPQGSFVLKKWFLPDIGFIFNLHSHCIVCIGWAF